MADLTGSGRTVIARAPVRVADVGGWTDTWFGSPGRVCHLAVGPGVRVQATFATRNELGDGAGNGPVRIDAPDLGSVYRCGPSASEGWASPEPSRQPLLEHAVGSVLEQVDLPGDVGIELAIRSAVPPGASLGTSASVVVAILGALDLLGTGQVRSPSELAVAAHQVETGRVGREAGVQDQWASAVGGAGLLAVGPYPKVRHRAIPLTADTEAGLTDRLVTVAFGPHDSSAVHNEVIDAVVGCGGGAHDQARRALGRLAAFADASADALEMGDIDAWAAVLTEATEAQRALHPALVGPAHQAAIACARSAGALGWKVNGAGGAGGSLTVVAGRGHSGDPRDGVARTDLAARLVALDPSWQILDLTPSSGVTAERL